MGLAVFDRPDKSERKGEGVAVGSVDPKRNRPDGKNMASRNFSAPETVVPADVLAVAFEAAKNMVKHGDARSKRAGLAFIGKFLRTTGGPTRSGAAAEPQPPTESESDEPDDAMTVERAARLRSRHSSRPERS